MPQDIPGWCPKTPIIAFKGSPLTSAWTQESFHSVPSTKKQAQKETNYVFTSNVIKERQDGTKVGRRDPSFVHPTSLFHAFTLKSINSKFLIGILGSRHHKKWKSEISSWELCSHRAGFDWWGHGRKLLQKAILGILLWVGKRQNYGLKNP